VPDGLINMTLGNAFADPDQEIVDTLTRGFVIDGQHAHCRPFVSANNRFTRRGNRHIIASAYRSSKKRQRRDARVRLRWANRLHCTAPLSASGSLGRRIRKSHMAAEEQNPRCMQKSRSPRAAMNHRRIFVILFCTRRVTATAVPSHFLSSTTTVTLTSVLTEPRTPPQGCAVPS